VTATGNAVVEEMRTRAARRAVKSCIVEEREEVSQVVRCGRKGKGSENGEEWDGMWDGMWDGESVESEIEVLLWGKGNAQKWLPHLAGEARSLRVSFSGTILEMIQLPFF